MNAKRLAYVASFAARMRRRTWGVLVAVGGASVAVGAGCSLGLDRSLIGQDAGGVDATGDDGGTASDAEASADGHVGVRTGGCSTDTDCQNAAAPAGACVTAAKCDPTWHVCMLDTCNVGACKSAVCNTTKMTCSVPTTYGYSAASFKVTYGGVGGAGPRYSIAAVWPFVFVITTNGVVAYDVIDPTDTTPTLVPVHGLPLFPEAAIAVGRRVYFVRRVEGAGPTTYRQAIGWVDVPQSPFVTSFNASTAFVTTPETSVAGIFSNDQDGIFIVYGSGMLFPTINVHPPIDDNTVFSPVPNAGLASGASLVAGSGSRLVAYRYDGTSLSPNFALVTGAGATGAQTTPEQQISSYGPLDSQATFGMGPDGTVLWNSAVLDLTDAGSDGISSARLTWLLSSATQANFDTSKAAYVDLQTYSPPANATVVGPTGWIDANTALALSAAGSLSTTSTTVQIALKGSGATPPSLVPGASTTLPVGPSDTGVATSNGFGYVLQHDDPTNTTATVSIFSPACAADQ